MCRIIVVLYVVTILLDNEVFAVEKTSRQKRCIVIQKQTGGRADSGEGSDDEDYEQPQPKAPIADRLKDNKYPGLNRKNEVETVPPDLLKYKIPNKVMFRRLRMKNRLQRNNFDM